MASIVDGMPPAASASASAASNGATQPSSPSSNVSSSLPEQQKVELPKTPSADVSTASLPHPPAVLSHHPVPPRKPSSSRRKDPAATRMRSTIACIRCRRSKVKCVNSNNSPGCDTCASSGRECVYPTPGVAHSMGPLLERPAGLPSSAVNPSTPNPVSGALPAGTPASNPPGSSASAVIVAAAAAAAASGAHSVPGASIAGQVRHRDEQRTEENGPSKRARHKRAPVPQAFGRDMRGPSEALDPIVLTAQVWIELFDIWQVHFSADLPFLHLPTIRRPLHQALSDTSITMPPASPLLLCAFLALTAPYHPGLISHHSPNSTAARPPNPTLAAEYYADAARLRLSGAAGNDLFSPDLQRVQALLMMSFYEWGCNNGPKASVFLSIAITMARMMGLQYEEGLDDSPFYRSVVPDPEEVSPAQTGVTDGLSSSMDDDFIQREIRRRTFWSCFILDRYYSTGKLRPNQLDPVAFRIQLPCSDPSFLFGHNARTLMITDDGSSHNRHSLDSGTKNGFHYDDQPESPRNSRLSNGFSDNDGAIPWEVGPDEGSVSRFVKMARIFGEVSQYLCLGGYRTEEAQFWSSDSKFLRNVEQIRKFSDCLPRSLHLSAANISAHVTNRTSTTYVAMHTLHLLATVMIHRDYLPFLPLLADQLHVPTVSDDGVTKYYNPTNVPPTGFFDKSARTMFRSAREIIDIFRTSQDWNIVPRTPMSGYALYQAVLLGIYAINFPWMDAQASLRRGDAYSAGANPTRDQQGLRAIHKAIEILASHFQTLKLCVHWLVTLQRVNVFFMNARVGMKDSDLPFSIPAADSDRDCFEIDGLLRAAVVTVEGTSGLKAMLATTRAGSSVKAEERPGEAVPRREGWTAINTAATPKVTDSVREGSPMKVDEEERAVEGYDLRFAPDDLMAHCCGGDWKEWSQTAVDNNGVGGWFSLVYQGE